jgi:hypothetical protein
MQPFTIGKFLLAQHHRSAVSVSIH